MSVHSKNDLRLYANRTHTVCISYTVQIHAGAGRVTNIGRARGIIGQGNKLARHGMGWDGVVIVGQEARPTNQQQWGEASTCGNEHGDC